MKLMLGVMSTIAALAIVLAGSAVEAGKEGSYAKVEIKGKLQTGIVAIGGETTGILIQAKDLTVELDIKDAKLRDEAEKLNGKTALVTGELTMRKGVTRGPRVVVVVTSLKAGE